MIERSNDDRFLAFPDFLKAMPREESGKRFIYMEASKEATDFQGEKILAKALADSAPFYAKYGNIDLEHNSIVGAKRGIPLPHLWEIGHPIEVRADSNGTFVKASVYQGDGDVAAQANAFWESMTNLYPPKRWYPSVGGQVMSRGMEIDPETGGPVPVITGVRWSNVGFTQTPVNPKVPGISTVPMGLLAKSLSAHGTMAIALKALEAGGGSDSALLTGGAALRTQSLDRGLQSYWDFRERMAGAIRASLCPATSAGLVEHAHATYGTSKSQSAEWTERFMGELRASHKARMN